MKTERLDKILAGTGLYSRAEARGAIASGLVTVDGAVVRRPETRVSRASEILAGGEPLDGAEFVYYMMNKPAGYVSASKEEGPYPPVTSLLPGFLQRRGLQCAGRLDADVTGLLLLTDDGAFIHRVTSPRSDVAKIYRVRTDGPLREEDERTLAGGVVLTGGTVYRPALLRVDRDDPRTALVTVTEGKFHEVKNLMAFLGRRVTALERLSIGGVELDPALAPGSCRRLTEEEAYRALDQIV